MRSRKTPVALAMAASLAVVGVVMAQDQEPIQPIAPAAQVNLLRIT